MFRFKFRIYIQLFLYMDKITFFLKNFNEYLTYVVKR